jgi:hypothetical protein
MRFSLFKEYGALNSKPVFAAFERSLINAGHTVGESDMHSDVAVIWSVLFNGRMLGNKPVWDYYRKTGRHVIVLEVGGLNRGTTWKVGIDGINGDAYFASKGHDNSRAKLLGHELKPWRKDGKYVMICGQHDKSLQWKNMPPMSKWIMDTIDELQKNTDRPIIFRPHPRCRLPDIERQYRNVYRQNPNQLSGSYDDFDLKYSDTWAVVNWSSNPGVEAVREGIPAFVGPSSLAYEVANTDLSQIESPLMPDREQWFNDLMHTEYTVEEIELGLPLKNLTQYL